MENRNTVALIGSRGKVGRFIMDTLLEKGYKVRALIRNTKNLTISDERVEIIKGDVRDAATVKQLIKGCRAVINTVGMSGDPKPHFAEITKMILGNLGEAKIDRYITVSKASLVVPGDQKNFMGSIVSFIRTLGSSKLLMDKQEELKVLQSSKFAWTLVRLPMVQNSSKANTNKAIKVNETSLPGNRIGNKEVAAFLVEQITDPRFINKAPFISN